MAIFGYAPIRPGSTINNPGKDARGARVIEQYRISDRALYVPEKGLAWRYLPLDAIRGVIPGHEVEEENSVMAEYRVEKPTIRVIYQGGVEVLKLERRKNADMLFNLLKAHSPSSQAFYEQVLKQGPEV